MPPRPAAAPFLFPLPPRPEPAPEVEVPRSLRESGIAHPEQLPAWVRQAAAAEEAQEAGELAPERSKSPRLGAGRGCGPVIDLSGAARGGLGLNPVTEMDMLGR